MNTTKNRCISSIQLLIHDILSKNFNKFSRSR